MNCRILVSVAAVAAIASGASADRISTFTITQADYLVTGFASGGLPSAGPLVSHFSNITGSYVLDIPSTGSWQVTMDSSFEIDSNRDGIADQFFATGPVDMGVRAGSGPATAWIRTGVALPDITLEPIPGMPFTLSGAMLDMDVDLDGPYPAGNFGSLAHADFSLYGGNVELFNQLLFAADIQIGGGDGLFDGFISGTSTITLSPIPAPASALSLLALGGLACRRRR